MAPARNVNNLHQATVPATNTARSMPPTRPSRRPVIAGVRSVPGRPAWVVLQGDPVQISDVVPQELLADSRSSKSYGGLLVRRRNYEDFYRATAGRRVPDPKQPQTAPESDDEAAKPRGSLSLQHNELQAEINELRRGMDEMKKMLQSVCDSVRQIQMPRVVGPGGVAMTRGPSSAVVSCSVAPSTLKPTVVTAASRSPSPATCARYSARSSP